MAIEAINNAMGTQATGYVPIKPVTANETVNTEVSENNQNIQIDSTTQVVESASEKGDANSNNQESQNQSAYPSNEQLKQAIEKINKNSLYNSEAVFGIHEGTNRVTIKLVDKDSKKVIKELPPEKTLDMIARVWEMAGILVDEKR